MAGRRDNEIGVTAGALGVLDTIARYAMGLAALVLLGCVGMLVFTYQVGSTGTAEQVSRNVQLFGGPAVLAAVVFGATIAYLNWGEEILGVLLLIGAGALVFAPSYLPLIFSGGSQTPNGTEALNAVSQAGIFLGIVAVIVLVVDGVTRIRDRAVLGAKADQLKFGKGIQEERDVQNVFLGKCWQLPYCRKFVREKCPIYHAKRTCWKERVGCMCEETVIRNAMQNKAVPKDPVAAAKMIPYNNRLPLAQKKERCAQCVIYNEHQKQKFKVALPALVIGAIGLYVLFRAPVAAMILQAIGGANRAIAEVTMGQGGQALNTNVGFPIHEILAGVVFFIGLAYAIKTLEALIFQAKI